MARRVPRSGGGSGGDPDAELASRVTVQAVDLPGGGWRRDPAEEADAAAPGGADDLDACLVDFPEGAVTASAEADRFTRGDALAYSVVWVLERPDAAADAFAALAGARFADCFASRLAASVEPGGPGAELLGHVVGEPVPLPTAERAAAHHVRLAAGTASGTFAVHLDLVVLQRGRVVTMLFLADSPRPPEGTADVAERVARRIPAA